MKKVMNSPDGFVDEMLEGLVAAHTSLIREGRVVRTAETVRDRVGVVSGGGSGHLPLFTGYVGRGLLDACAVGDVFAGPSVEACQQAIRAADGGHGVLRLYGNYGGDRMNFDLAGEFLEGEIRTTTVLGTDDIASAGPDEMPKRRGVAGIVYAYKIAGAAAARGLGLDAVTALAQRAVSRCRTIGVALAPCRIPGAAGPTFSLGEGEIELGIGIHGEPGIWRDRLKPADALADEMLDRLLAEPVEGTSKRLSVLVNGLGATPLEELFIVYRRVAMRLGGAGYTIVRPLVAPMVTSMEMAGLSLSLFHLDDELEGLLGAPASCPFWTV